MQVAFGRIASEAAAELKDLHVETPAIKFVIDRAQAADLSADLERIALKMQVGRLQASDANELMNVPFTGRPISLSARAYAVATRRLLTFKTWAAYAHVGHRCWISGRLKTSAATAIFPLSRRRSIAKPAATAGLRKGDRRGGGQLP
jgi:hypothetical protein